MQLKLQEAGAPQSCHHPHATHTVVNCPERAYIATRYLSWQVILNTLSLGSRKLLLVGCSHVTRQSKYPGKNREIFLVVRS
jgi:hypothetical protein